MPLISLFAAMAVVTAGGGAGQGGQQQGVFGDGFLLGGPAGNVGKQVGHLIAGQLVGNGQDQAVLGEGVGHLAEGRLAVPGHGGGLVHGGEAGGGRVVLHAPAAVGGHGFGFKERPQGVQLPLQLADLVVDVLGHQEAAVAAGGRAAADGEGVVEGLELLHAAAGVGGEAVADGEGEGPGVLVGFAQVGKAPLLLGVLGGLVRKVRFLAAAQGRGALAQGVQAGVFGLELVLQPGDLLKVGGGLGGGQGQAGGQVVDPGAHGADGIVDLFKGHGRHGDFSFRLAGWTRFTSSGPAGHLPLPGEGFWAHLSGELAAKLTEGL